MALMSTPSRSRLRRCWWVGVVSLLLAGSPGPAHAQLPFPFPQALPFAGVVDALRLEVSALDEVQLVLASAGEIHYTSSGVGLAQFQLLSPGVPDVDQPALASGPFNQVYVVFVEHAVAGPDIVRTTNVGGPFSLPVNMTVGANLDRHPDVAVLGNGQSEVVWETEATPGVREVYLRRANGAALVIAAGHDPVVAAVGLNESFVAYVRAGQVFGRFVNSAGQPGTELVIVSGALGATDLRLCATSSGAIHVLFRASDALHHTWHIGAGFQPPVLVASAVDGPGSLAVAPDGTVRIVYAQGGITWLVQGAPGTLGAPQAVSPTTQTSDPQVAVDSHGYAHVAYRHNAGARYLNNVPPPVAILDATPQAGEQPLPVQFTSASTGVITSHQWNFGDGQGSTAPHPLHTYAAPGNYHVSLTVSGPGGSDTEMRLGFIQVTAPTHVLELPPIAVHPGETGIQHLVLATHPVALQGFQLVVAHDPSLVTVSGFNLNSTVTTGYAPDFVDMQLAPGGQSIAVLTVILESTIPIKGIFMPPGVRQPIANLAYSISPAALVGSSLQLSFVNHLGIPPGHNIFTIIGAFSVLPFRVHGVLNVVDPGVRFVRGDVSMNQMVDIGDAIQLLAFLFSGGPLPCHDAADANDSGAVDIADAIKILSYLFSGATPPPYPFPARGLDPTPDNLPGC